MTHLRYRFTDLNDRINTRYLTDKVERKEESERYTTNLGPGALDLRLTVDTHSNLISIEDVQKIQVLAATMPEIEMKYRSI
jgi:hypothetical protein